MLQVVQEHQTPQGTLKEVLDKQADNLDGVLVIGMGKDDTMFFVSSQMTNYQKTWLLQFAEYVHAKNCFEGTDIT